MLKEEEGIQVKKKINKNKNISTIKRGGEKRNKTTTKTRILILNYFVLETFQCRIPGSRKR